MRTDSSNGTAGNMNNAWQIGAGIKLMIWFKKYIIPYNGRLRIVSMHTTQHIWIQVNELEDISSFF